MSWSKSNPMGVITQSEAMQIKRLCDVKFDLIGFIDGAWKKTANGNVGGMGGLIQGQNENVIFTFSGPVICNCSYEAEWSALEFMLNSYAVSK